MLWLLRIISGYLTVIFYGEFPEKILNLTATNKIFIWNSRLDKKGIISCISVKDFKRLRFIIKNSGVKMHILKKHGLPFKVEKNKKRSGIIVGAIILIAFLSFMSSRVWIIDIDGNEKIKCEEIFSALSEIGITEGVPRKNINPKSQREKLLLKIDSLAWASINEEGCKITVNVSEIKNNKPQKNLPSNLKAKADGIITKINVTSGNCIVKKGDTVKKGDILVSGIIERKEDTSFVRSSGTVWAFTERSFTVTENFKQTIAEENSKRKTKRVLEFFSLKIPLYLGKENKSYNSFYKVRTLSLFNQELPIRIHEKKFNFTDKYQVTYSKEILIKKLQKEICELANSQGIKEYNVSSQQTDETKDSLTLNQIITAQENIAENEDIILDQAMP